MLKILVVIATIIFFIIEYKGSVQMDNLRQPYFSFSFEPKFNTYDEPIIDCEGVPGKCSGGQNGNASGLVLAYMSSSSQRNDEINNLTSVKKDITSEEMLSVLIKRGEITNHLQVKDLNDVQKYLFYDWLKLLLFTIIFFIILSHIGLRIILYVINGKRLRQSL